MLPSPTVMLAPAPVALLRRAACRLGRAGQNQAPRRALGCYLDENTRSLVARALSNDRDAVDTLFQRYRERLRSALRKLVGPKYRLLLADSEDATQDAILSALRRLSQFDTAATARSSPGC